MQWSEVSISTSTETQDVVAEIFHDLGASGVVIEDPEVVNGYIREGAWDYSGVPQAEENGLVLVKAYLPADEELPGRMRELAQRLENLQISAPESCGPCKVSSALLRDEEHEPDPALMELLEEEMAREGEKVFASRSAFVEQLAPIFQQLYTTMSGGREEVSLGYVSHCQRGPLLEVIRRDRAKDRAVGYSLHGIHRDELEILLDGHPMRREGSQGQLKTFVIALKLAQYEYLMKGQGNMPLLLLDDIFDKLDATRVEQIIRLVASQQFGQIFITDTNRDHIDQILSHNDFDYKLFNVNDGEICLSAKNSQ